MSKTTKIIAALGIVAGLGVAALPAFTYATDPVSTTGDVEVQVEVLPAIAMTITGNNDTGTESHGVFTVVAEPTGNPSTSGYYELSNHVYTASTDATVDSEKTYYTLVTPTYAAVDNSAPAGLTGTLDGHTVDTVAGTSSSFTALLPNSAKFGDISAVDPQNSFGSIVTVYTNSNSGYTLSVKDKDDNTDLTHITGAFYIPAQDGTEVAAGTAGWNYDTTVLAGGTTGAKTAAGITNAVVAIDGLASKTSGGRVTKVDYNVATGGDQAAGYYTDTIVYTATTN
ncbi:hypothetical protein IKW75_00325 [Candidatus Saccharibacteria bacterium]|nr:hypothetical protein [Candidatus Saccharibacteria bacterium]